MIRVSIAVSGGNLWVANTGSGTIGEYNATTGAAINAALISGLSVPIGHRGVGRESVGHERWQRHDW